MKRREFVRRIGLLAASGATASSRAASCGGACCPVDEVATPVGVPSPAHSFEMLSRLSLTELDDEHEEHPVLVSDGQEGDWMFSLRRLPYPADQEVISCFRKTDATWREQAPVTSEAGQFEYPAASCAPGGRPVVAWNQIEDGVWKIAVSLWEGGSFGQPQVFEGGRGRFLGPVLCSASEDRHWIAWESFSQGRLSLFLSRYEKGAWAEPVEIRGGGDRSLMEPALAADEAGQLYLASGVTEGVDRHVELRIFNGSRLALEKTVPIAEGGGLRDRVNLNTHPAVGIDEKGRVWVSWENNRETSRLEDGDNFTGDRICGLVCYHEGRILECSRRGRFVFAGKNDHLPTFVKDPAGHLFLVTACGGDFSGSPFWKYRVSWLDGEWAEPVEFFQTRQKGDLFRPAVLVDSDGSLEMAFVPEETFSKEDENPLLEEGVVRQRVNQLELLRWSGPTFGAEEGALALKEAIVKEAVPRENFFPVFSGRPRVARRTKELGGEIYTLVLGNFHEHSNNSSCWPAGCDGTVHDDYRFGMFSEGYDVMGNTDHGYTMTEVYWRKSLRMVQFYQESEAFLPLPAFEWTLSNGRKREIGHGVGHKNLVFPSIQEARKFVRNRHEIFSVHSPETENATKLWEFLREREIDCVTIPHHPADEVHPTDWEVHDPRYQTVVEVFQCRGNAEYPGCPRELNVSRHRPIQNEKAFLDYALREKGYRMGFIASGDHNGIGVGLAALWVKELSQAGVVEALRSGRTFATTGDKIFVDLHVNGAWYGQPAGLAAAPRLQIQAEGVLPLERVEILRDSRVIATIEEGLEGAQYAGEFVDEDFAEQGGGAYYYLRVTQENGHLAWSSPIWLEA
ncbi:MAG: hypothetical protein AAF555_03765 [Verrucomicrobiota bacterium]